MMLPKLPLLGFGAMRLPTLGKDDMIDIPQVSKMADHYLASGLNYFDTAYPYHGSKSEGALMEAVVKRRARDSFMLADKLPMWHINGEGDAPRLFAEQLGRLSVDYIDFYMMHGMNKSRIPIAKKNKVFEYLKRLKGEGKVRHIGFSFHDDAECIHMVMDAFPEMEFAQMQLNYYDIILGHAGDILEAAVSRGVPVIAMEPVRGGTLANLPAKCAELITNRSPGATAASLALRYVMSLPGVCMTLSGMSNLAQVEENCATVSDFSPTGEDDDKLIKDILKELGRESAVPCTACNYCAEGCPAGIEIPKAFSMHNMAKRTNDSWNPGVMYRSIPEGKRAKDCTSCGKCKPLCPQGIDIPAELSKITF